MAQISGVGLGLAVSGGILIYSGLFNQPVGAILTSVVHGKAPSPGPAQSYVATGPGSAAGTSYTVPPPSAATAAAATNQALARLLAAPYGWSVGAEWTSLVALWNQESGWSNTAFNASGAYGVAQALGHATDGEAATGQRTVGATGPGVNDAYGGYGLSVSQAEAANAGNAQAQIIWGLNYIKTTYGDPITAWQHEAANGWY